MLSVRLAEWQTVIEARLGQTPLLFKLSSPGRHFAMNALAVLAIIDALGGDTARALLDLGAWQPVDGRGVRERRILDDIEENYGFDLIDDAYNANPASVSAALEMLTAITPQSVVGRGRRIAILGDMLELGPSEIALHASLAELPALEQIDLVHCVGKRMKYLWKALPPEKRGMKFKASKKLAGEAANLVEAGDVVLVKGSLGVGLAVVVDALRKLGQAAPNPSHRGA